eukprot:GHVS01028403.1.p1 GENE.GHVS01028403.1~~GHVS01028403.1.p1  ORF type:complete len:502 (+),score=93.02 GHVS01028403.1:177-1508(+)
MDKPIFTDAVGDGQFRICCPPSLSPSSSSLADYEARLGHSVSHPNFTTIQRPNNSPSWIFPSPPPPPPRRSSPRRSPLLPLIADHLPRAPPLFSRAARRPIPFCRQFHPRQQQPPPSSPSPSPSSSVVDKGVGEEGRSRAGLLAYRPNLSAGVSAIWPSAGRVEFDDVCVEYRPGLTPALSHVSFVVYPGETVGIVGRTGAGKSSVCMALCRIVRYSGNIRIDGVDIRHVPHSLLRSRLAVVPQSSVIFSGTVRSNLDPENRLPDSHLWEYLDKCQLKKIIQALPKGLETCISANIDSRATDPKSRRLRRSTNPPAYKSGSPAVKGEDTTPHPPPAVEEGERLSLGQKQLLCFCRALLRDAPVMCLDEPNSSVDSRVEDEVLFKTLQKDLRHCTILIITHRLRAVLDNCDKVLVFDRSRLVETGNPRTLLKDPTSKFSALHRY